MLFQAQNELIKAHLTKKQIHLLCQTNMTQQKVVLTIAYKLRNEYKSILTSNLEL